MLCVNVKVKYCTGWDITNLTLTSVLETLFYFIMQKEEFHLQVNVKPLTHDILRGRKGTGPLPLSTIMSRGLTVIPGVRARREDETTR